VHGVDGLAVRQSVPDRGEFAASSVTHGTRTSRKFQTQPLRPEGLRIRKISVAPADGMKLDSSSPVPPSGGCSTTISARESGIR
jgi:hypothetical protein